MWRVFLLKKVYIVDRNRYVMESTSKCKLKFLRLSTLQCLQRMMGAGVRWLAGGGERKPKAVKLPLVG